MSYRIDLAGRVAWAKQEYKVIKGAVIAVDGGFAV